MQVEEEIVWKCQYCGVHNTVDVDLTAASKQDFIEDCRICCRPNRIIITISEEERIFVESKFTDE